MKLKRFFIKLINYEYWPMWAFYFPLFFVFFYKGLKNGQMFFFTNVNKNLDEFGGLFFDSKRVIDKKIPLSYRAEHILIEKGKQFKIQDLKFSFPLIIKPDQGERGRGVKKINNESELAEYFKLPAKEDLLIQPYIDWSKEYGVFMAINPVNLKYEILSLTEKKYFSIIGDGKLNIEQLVKQSQRGLVFYDEITSRYNSNLKEIPAKGKTIVLHTQGNHSKGTEFIDISHLITGSMTRSFGNFMKGLDGFEYGRLDVKCKSFEDLESFNHLKVIEFNGLAAEPISIYDSRIGYFNSLGKFLKHWKRLEDISKFNKNRQIESVPTSKILKKILQKRLKS